MTDHTPPWLDELLKDAAHTYNRPPDERQMPLEAMWSEIDAQSFGTSRARSHGRYWLGVAAALLVGVGIGRFSSSSGRAPAATFVALPSPNGRQNDTAVTTASRLPVTEPLDAATSKYLGQAAALLIALPTDANGRRADRPFLKRANELLLTTRLLLDSQAAQDPSLRNLLEDLELVLVQVVQLDKNRDHARQTELDLIQQALDQHDVIPRLRTAASEYAAD
jgi:hypothetical protein